MMIPISYHAQWKGRAMPRHPMRSNRHSTSVRHCIISALLIAVVCHWGRASAQEQALPKPSASQPHAVYPYWARPPGYEQDHDTWRGASGADVGETQPDPDRLPTRVDNSNRPQYPPVYKQRWNACGQFTAIASIFTYEMNVLGETAADSRKRRFPAHFSWNMVNRARDTGSEAYHGWEVAKHVGIPTVDTYGGVRLDKIGVWPDGYHIWRNAMKHRVAGYRYTPATTVEQLNEAKGWLYDRNSPRKGREVIGGLLAIDGRMGEIEKATVKIPDGEYCAGQDIWTRWGSVNYGHGMACVGYDDQIGWDLNGDGKITNDLDINDDGEVTLADWERGAYIIVNSWGGQWSGDGRIYLLYSAMTDADWKRGMYFGRVEVARHAPRLTARLKIESSDRSNLRVTFGISRRADAEAPEHSYAPEVLNGWPIFGQANAGNVPMAGHDDHDPIEVGIDLTPLLDQLGSGNRPMGRLFIKISQSKNSDARGRLHEAAIRLYNKRGKLLNEVPFQVEQDQFGHTPLELSSGLH